MNQKQYLQCSPSCDQKLIDPSQNYIQQCKTSIQQETLKQPVNLLPNSIICLKDLADGTWLWRKSHMKLLKPCKSNRTIKKLKMSKSSKRKVSFVFKLFSLFY